ncbi:MAG: type II secretion system protein [Planctomycetaceae bacterium]|nr:MAG: type II secretion system protein [Planctomycetaceae bacterium]
MKNRRNNPGFTLIELLVVIAIVMLLVSILVPALARAKMLAKIAKTHAELRVITLAIEMYKHEQNDLIPPTRFSCSSRTAYDLPVELLRYLHGGRKNDVDIVQMPDPFTPSECYKYRAVGPAIVNESTIIPDAATLWIPDGFPNTDADTGKYYSDRKTSPVRYAVYSMGPNPQSEKFDIPGRLPIPGKYWLKNASESGVIVHFEDNTGQVRMSP